MQRTFSTFPGAMPGVGLLVLRSFLGTSVIVHSIIFIVGWENPSLLAWLGCLAGVGCGSLLLAGFLTPLVSILIWLVAAFILIAGLDSLPIILDKINVSAVCGILVATAILLLGPGAFSVDARLFGRREIIFPTSTRNPRS